MLGAELFQVVKIANTGGDEPAFKIGVNGAGGLRGGALVLIVKVFSISRLIDLLTSYSVLIAAPRLIHSSKISASISLSLRAVWSSINSVLPVR